MELNKIYYTDCLEGIKQLDNNSVSLVITSPPYAMQRKFQYGGINEKDYPEWTLKWMEELRPKLKDDASVCINIRPHIKNGEISDYVLRTRLALREKPVNRNYECQCGYKQHRDIVGAMNILNFNEKDIHIERYKKLSYLRID